MDENLPAYKVRREKEAPLFFSGARVPSRAAAPQKPRKRREQTPGPSLTA